MSSPSLGAASATDALLSAGSRIGRYFGLTSMLPTTFLVLWTYALVSSGAVTGRPQLSQLDEAFSPSFPKIGALVLTVLLVALFMHPFQFGMTQLLEGYWGRFSVSLLLGSVRANAYRRRIRRLSKLADRYKRALFAGAEITIPRGASPTETDLVILEATLRSATGDPLIRALIGREEVVRKRAEFPEREDRVMPTRLGNALRRYEDLAGSAYSIDPFVTAPHFSLVADREHYRYVEDAQQQMDLTLRLTAVSVLATLVTVGALVTDGPWLLITLIPYGLAYLAYRGSVSAARGYGVALMTMIDLNRFALYQSLMAPRPDSLAAERGQNEQLMDMLRGSTDVDMVHRDADSQDPNAAEE